jgi:hypothetical protein
MDTLDVTADDGPIYSRKEHARALRLTPRRTRIIVCDFQIFNYMTSVTSIGFDVRVHCVWHLGAWPGARPCQSRKSTPRTDSAKLMISKDRDRYTLPTMTGPLSTQSHGRRGFCLCGSECQYRSQQQRRAVFICGRPTIALILCHSPALATPFTQRNCPIKHNDWGIQIHII